MVLVFVRMQLDHSLFEDWYSCFVHELAFADVEVAVHYMHWASSVWESSTADCESHMESGFDSMVNNTDT